MSLPHRRPPPFIKRRPYSWLDRVRDTAPWVVLYIAVTMVAAATIMRLLLAMEG